MDLRRQERRWRFCVGDGDDDGCFWLCFCFYFQICNSLLINKRDCLATDAEVDGLNLEAEKFIKQKLNNPIILVIKVSKTHDEHIQIIDVDIGIVVLVLTISRNFSCRNLIFINYQAKENMKN